MSYKTILAVLTPNGEAGPAPLMPTALDLAARWQAHLTLMIMVPQITTYIDGGVGYAGYVSVEDDLVGVKKANEMKDAIDHQARSNGVTVTTMVAREAFDLNMARFVANGRLHDVILMRRDETLAQYLVEAALFETGRPCLMVPVARPNMVALKKILVAWDGTLQSSRAVHEAMPLLKHAETIEIITISGEKNLKSHCSGADLARLLTAHDLVVTATDLPAEHKAGNMLMDYALAKDIDLLVTGAYAHSRFRQMIFGGVTSTLLAEARLPVLMAH